MLPPPVPPLPPDVWDDFVEKLRRGPSPKQVEAAKKLLALSRNIATPGDPDYDEPETQRAIAERRRNSQPIAGLRRVEPKPPGSVLLTTREIAARRRARERRG